MPRIVPVDCPSCGASLRLPAGTREATCDYCGQASTFDRSGTRRGDETPARVASGAAARGPTLKRIVVVVALLAAVGLAVQLGLQWLADSAFGRAH